MASLTHDSLIDMTDDAEIASPAKKATARAPKAPKAAGSAVEARKPRAAAAVEGQEAKPKGRKKKAEPLQELAPAQVLKGPSFPFDVDHVLALGSRCGLPADRAARDQLSAQHGTLPVLASHHQMPSGCTGNGLASGQAIEPANADCDNIRQVVQDVELLCASPAAGPDSTPAVPQSELPLRDRLQNVRHLLHEAGLSPSEAMLSLSSLAADDAAKASGAIICLTASNNTADPACGHMSGADSVGQSDIDMHHSSDRMPVPDLAGGRTYDEVISLISPTPKSVRTALDRRIDEDSPLQPPFLTPQPGCPGGSPPSQLHPSLVNAISPLALGSQCLLQHNARQSQQQQDGSSAQLAYSLESVGQSTQDRSDALQQQQHVTICSEVSESWKNTEAGSAVAAEQRKAGSEVDQSMHGSAGCHQSPVSSPSDASQHGKKRSR